MCCSGGVPRRFGMAEQPAKTGVPAAYQV